MKRPSTLATRRAPVLLLAALSLGGPAVLHAASPAKSTSAPSKNDAYPAASSAKTAAAPSDFVNCPMIGWPELLPHFLQADAEFPTNDTAGDNVPDCAFHQWSWEAFVWATALDTNGVPRFLTLPTPEDLLDTAQTGAALKAKTRPLKLGTRSFQAHATTGYVEGAGAIVEADGNMMVSQNGYPVYASVHMNSSYATTAKRNLIVTGGYQNQPADDYFDVGAAVFKATWLRLDPGQQPPAGAYTTQAEVPVLTVYRTKNSMSVAPSGQTTTVTVALVGLHVVGYTVNHPEFLWGTFEHKDNSPAFPDGTFDQASTLSDPHGYTFYKAGTPFNQTNLPSTDASGKPTLSFDLATQKFSPVTNAVLANKTGSETNSPNGPVNISNLNASAQNFFAGQPAPQAVFGNYNLIGTVWMAPNSYSLTSDQSNAVGSVNLANVTAETFVQRPMLLPNNTNPNVVLNCFLCHNATSYNFQNYPPKLPSRRIALSHVLAVGSPYAVPNVLPVKIPTSQGAPETPAKPTAVNSPSAARK